MIKYVGVGRSGGVSDNGGWKQIGLVVIMSADVTGGLNWYMYMKHKVNTTALISAYFYSNSSMRDHLRDHPIGHENVASQDRWSLVTVQLH